MRRKQRLWAIALGCLLLIAGCADAAPVFEVPAQQEENAHPILLSINGTPVPVLWEENQSVKELFSLLENESITIATERYGGFEQVGRLPQSIANDDVQMTAAAGDIVLYNGNSIVLFYGSNAWAYTKLGRIDGMPAKEIQKLLDAEETSVTLSLAE